MVVANSYNKPIHHNRALLLGGVVSIVVRKYHKEVRLYIFLLSIKNGGLINSTFQSQINKLIQTGQVFHIQPVVLFPAEFCQSATKSKFQ